MTEVLGTIAVAAEFRELHTMTEMKQANQLLDSIWQGDASSRFDPALLVAMAHAGNYVVGVFRDDEMVGTCVGFFAAPAGGTLHSHIAGVRSDQVGQGVGRELKEHQRLWCMARGISTITWTFDPLVARNAYFNISRLGAEATEYVVNFYGAMSDNVNVGQASDRMLASWSVNRPRLGPFSADGLPLVLDHGPDGEPVEARVDAGKIALRIPADIEHLRTTDPEQAIRWRLALRKQLGDRMSAGWHVTGFDKSGIYIMEALET